ncbi:GH3 domain-containing protein [Hypomesus transpacificus]|uniref:GH3 domain-containing protein n=1 Tax=Hypomesus transpacificus TaxID=137520 RepID=UPI001F071795|nr:GH3 domain-containing protein [Hypomesus transpacificus]XP_046888023.1 GH3 domain-containing protein [Hypomesus transpacificus]
MITQRQKIILSALVFVIVSIVIAIGKTQELLSMPSPLTSTLGILSVGGMTLLWRDISSQIKGQNRTLSSLLSQYFAVKFVGWLGKRQRSKLEADTLNVRQVQEETLLKRLRKNAQTYYGKQYDFSSIKDCETYCLRHPVTTYKHYRELIKRIALGEDKVIIAEKPLILALTSGTSGASAMLLSTKDTNTEFFLQGVAVCLDAMRGAFPASESLQRTTKLFYTPTFRQSEAGIPIGPNSSTPASSRHMLNLYTTPAPAFQVPSEKDTLYLHLLFALKDPSVGTLESNFSSTVFYAFSALQDRWQELVEDIELGHISQTLALESAVRTSLESLMKPDPGRASELRAQFHQGFLGIAKRLWPQLNLVLTVDSGSNQIYGEMLREHYCQGVPFYSPFYAATEGLIGVNLWPEEQPRRYLLCPRSMFCEFLPEASLDQEQPKTHLMDQVEEGHNYELVITNASGLFRYRLGDIVKVVGFHNQCPVVEFQYRRGQMLSVRGEKISESMFLGALKKAVEQWPGANLLDYSCAESGLLGDSSGGSDPHYQVFVELEGVRNISEEQRYKLDQCLQEDSAVYKSFRLKGSIGPMRVHLVAGGAFNELRKQMMSFSNTSPNTFKMHRVLRRKEYADFLLGKTVS